MANDNNQKMNLLPTKNWYKQSHEDHHDLNVWESHPNTASRWKAQPVLDWVESLVAATEDGERKDGKANGKVVVAGIALSSPIEVPYSVPWAMQSSTYQPPLLSDQRRALPLSRPVWTDLSFLEQDENPQSYGYFRQIASLLVEIESLPEQVLTDQLRHDFNVATHRLASTFHSIMHQSPYESEDEKRLALFTLYEIIIGKFQQIVETATSTNKQSAAIAAGNVSHLSPGRASSSHVAISPEKKRDLSEYMTNWLRANWTNPYPDEKGLEEMARDCGTTASIVSNWLINARTRKWRPAIAKATEMNRPSRMLLEDSLCIFDGKEIRPLTDEDDDEEGPSSKRIKRSYSSHV